MHTIKENIQNIHPKKGKGQKDKRTFFINPKPKIKMKKKNPKSIILSQTDLENLIRVSVIEASTFDLRSWYLPIEINIDTLEFLQGSWTYGYNYSVGFFVALKVEQFEPEPQGKTIDEMVEILLETAQIKCEDFFSNFPVVWKHTTHKNKKQKQKQVKIMDMTWTEWIQGCSDSWKNDGKTQTKIGEKVKPYLLKVEKKRTDTLIAVASRAWKLYKGENI